MEPTTQAPAPWGEERLVLAMVGLPARGKTFFANRLARYLRWGGRRARVFNVGDTRRRMFGAAQPASFFDPANPEGARARRRAARATLEQVLEWLGDAPGVAVYDATNVTRARRAWLRRRCEAAGLQVIFVESVCTDAARVEANVRRQKARSPDYAGMDADRAVEDFHRRIAFYAAVYEPLDERDGSWIRLQDVGRHVEVHRVAGHLASRLVSYLMHLHDTPRTIWLTRHGESVYNLSGRIGGDPELTEAGREYARRLAVAVRESFGDGPLQVWTSTLRRTLQTAAPLGRPVLSLKALDEIDAGLYDGLTYEQIAHRFPDEFAARRRDKLRYRYPRGESYQDLIQRLDPVVHELERVRTPLLVVAHNAVVRVLYAYLMDLAPDACPHVDIPLHAVLAIRPEAYGCTEERLELGPERRG